MRGRILFVAGLAVGYVLGARAGRGAYDTIRARVQGVVDDPRTKQAATKAKDAVGEAAGAIGGAVSEGVAEGRKQGSPDATLQENVSSVVPDALDEDRPIASD